MWDSPLHLIIILFVLAVLCIPYFVPAIIAYARRKANRGTILLVNVFLGWTLVGWIVALVLAVKNDAGEQPPQ